MQGNKRISQDRLNNNNDQIPRQSTTIPPNQNNPIISFPIGQILLIIIIPLIGLGGYYIFSSTPLTCDMSIPGNRDFNQYYGLDGRTNHFTTPTADECDSTVIFKSIFPSLVLKSDHSPSSFLLLEKYGTGKTLLRCEYYKSLKADSYLKILLLNKQISEYIERFLSRRSTKEQDCGKTNCLEGWTENEFAQLLLSTLVTNVISIMQDDQIKLKTNSIEEKFHLIRIICYYYNGFGTNELEKFINRFLDKSGDSKYEASKAVVQYREKNVAYDKPLYAHFKKDLQKFSILKQDFKRLHLLLSIAEGEGFQHKASGTNMYENIFNDLTLFSLYIKKELDKTPVFIIDGLDENRYFFQGQSVNKAAMQSFARSSISEKIIAEDMTNNFYLSMFYPKIKGIDIDNVIIRKDKFPTLSIDWTTNSLINYADYVLQQMNKKASKSRCQSFKDFKALVNYSDKRIANIINKISTPRELHFFMTYLIKQLNDHAGVEKNSFIATFENVKAAFRKSKKHGARIERERVDEEEEDEEE